MILPRQDKDGNYYISYSQIESFNSLKGFNTGLKGINEYMISYFFKKRWPDQGWGLFGSQVEDYICYRDYTNDQLNELDTELRDQVVEALGSFTDAEKEVLNTVKPLGTYQTELKIWLDDNIYVLGYIDDCTEDLMHLRDYKTGSKSSTRKYYTDKYKQLDIYSLYVLQETGKMPERLEVVMIERKGNCFGMVERRDLLTVGKEVWYHERETSEERLFQIEADIRKTIKDISFYYEIFLDMQSKLS